MAATCKVVCPKNVLEWNAKTRIFGYVDTCCMSKIRIFGYVENVLYVENPDFGYVENVLYVENLDFRVC